MKRIVCFCLSIFLLFIPFRVGAVGASAKAAILINAETGEVIYEQNANERLPMASTTKIMTALLLCEADDMQREITVTSEMVRVEGTSMGLLAGDKVTFEALLYGMLLASGNDAANVTAYSLGGTVDGFVKLMNEKAKELGLNNTHFETPSGLDGDEHYTTAKDLSILAKYAMENKQFAKAAGSKSAVLYYGNPPYRRTLTNHNKLLKTYDGAIGVKTGFTKKAGRCLVSCAEKDGKRVIAVTLKATNDWNDHKALLDYGLASIKITEICPEITEYTIPVISSNDNLTVKVNKFTVNSLETEGFSYKVNLPRFVYAPIKKGEAVGDIVYYKEGKEIARKVLVSKKDIQKTEAQKRPIDRFSDCLKSIFKSIWEI